MKDVIAIISIVLFFATLFAAVKGLDLKTRRGWFIVLFGFLSGFLLCLALDIDIINSAFGGFLISLIATHAGLSHLRINRWLSKSKYYK